MAAAVATRVVLACCLCAVLFSCSLPTVSGAWPWEVGLLKNKTTTTEATPSKSSTLTTGAPSTTTSTPPTPESTPRPRSRPRSNSKKHHHLHTSTTPQPTTKDYTIGTTTTTEAPPPSVPQVVVQTDPQLFASVQPQLPAVPPPEMSPIVIVEPDSYPDANRAYRSMYEQPYGSMYPPPMSYAPPVPYYSPPPPPPLARYPSPYDPYAFGGYPSYQWPAIEPSYLRPYRSYPFAPMPSLQSYPIDYSPYPWWQPQVQGMMVGADGSAAPAIQGGCTSEPKRDREELTPALKDAPVDQKVEEPSPTYVSLLPSYTAKVDSLATPTRTREGSNVKVEKPFIVEEKAEQPNIAPGNNAYGMVDTVGKENHILRNNPYQPAPPSSYWPGYYEQNQWPQWNQWQQWPGSQQSQYPYSVGPQQPSVVQSQKRQAPFYGWGGRQYA
ncbi:leucine-rich repeat extensin-like protein 2 [Schistocerca americana]|uniref:leucine-rich repeat extensin-like protein 2 n=1 Tax=Schistocerca americana TaxID=7009 RepID=UPI001F4FD1FE|nr:leucine-rich repeat extensin-like protein 2 [Schistocerca americana]